MCFVINGIKAIFANFFTCNFSIKQLLTSKENYFDRVPIEIPFWNFGLIFLIKSLNKYHYFQLFQNAAFPGALKWKFGSMTFDTWIFFGKFVHIIWKPVSRALKWDLAEISILKFDELFLPKGTKNAQFLSIARNFERRYFRNPAFENSEKIQVCISQ